MRDKEPPAAEVAPREQLRAPCSPSPHSALSLHPTTWSDRGAFKTLLAAHAQLFVCSWEFLRKKKKKKKKRAGDPGSAGAGASLLQPAEYKAAFLPRPRGRSGFLLRGLRGAGHTWGRTPSGARRPGGRAGESQVPVRGRARPPRPDRGGGEWPRECVRTRLRGRLSAVWAATAATATVSGGRREAGCCGISGWQEDRRVPTAALPSPRAPVGRAHLGGSRAAPPSRASLGIRRGARARRGRAGPLPLPARSPPPRVPSGARGAAGSSLRSRSYRGCRVRLAEDKVRGAGGDARV